MQVNVEGPPSVERLVGSDGVEELPVELDVVTQASLKRNQTEAIFDRLAAMEKTLAAGDKTPDPAFVKSKREH